MNQMFKDLSISLYRNGETRQRIVNIILSATIVMCIPALAVSIIENSSTLSIIMISYAIVTSAISMLVINKYKKYTLGVCLLIVAMDYIGMPILHFSSGGLNSGMPAWEIFAFTLIFLTTDGVLSYCLAGVCMAIWIMMFIQEWLHPEFVTPIGDPQMVFVDIFVAVILVSTCFGIIFRFEKKIFEEQRKSILISQRETKEALAKYKRASRAKGDFLANMSHEIRTPVNVISGMNEMILRENRDERINEYASEISGATDSLVAIVNQVLDYSKIDSDEFVLEPVEYSMTKLLCDCFSLVSEKAERKHLELKIRNNPYLPTKLYGDEVRVRIIFMNLLTNAIKYTMEGYVSMSVDFSHVDDDNIRVRVTVKDTGVGMNKEQLDNAFVVVKEDSGEEGRSVSGVGLGLYIINQYAKLMGGEATVESEYGSGSVFTVCFEQKIADRTPAGNMAEKLYVKGKEKADYKVRFTAPKANILSVDDVKMNHDVIRALLKNTKVNIDSVFGGEDAIRAVKEKKYDLILMDHMMPEMDGIEALSEIRKLENGKCPCVVLTANAVSGNEEEYKKSGFNGYLSKPVSGEDLEKTVMNFLPENLLEEGNISPESPKKEESVNKKAERKEEKKEIMETPREAIEKLEFIDIDKGLEYCADSFELFLEAIEGYVGADSRYNELIKNFEDKNWDEYRVCIHAVKSSSLLIGSLDLYEHAKALEAAVKEGDIPYVLNHHETVLNEYNEKLGRISEALKACGR